MVYSDQPALTRLQPCIIRLTNGGSLVGQLTSDYAVVNDPAPRVIEVDTGDVESGFGTRRNSNWEYYDITSGKPPVFEAFSKTCLWITENRVKCVDGYAKCSWKNLSDDAVTGTCGLQGHNGKDENPMERKTSLCHLRVAYELTDTVVALK